MTKQSQSSCVNISITHDDSLEYDETFTISLTTNDPSVILQQENADITILNINSMLAISYPIHNFYVDMVSV